MNLDPSNGQLLIRTGVAGRAARLGHRLTIVIGDWRGVVAFDGETPVEVTLDVDVASLAVVEGEGGVKALSAAEKTLARNNALRSLDPSHYPSIVFHSTEIEAADEGYRLRGELTIHGVTKRRTVALAVEQHRDGWRLTGNEKVRQSDFGVKPYSLMLGSLKVADEVTVSFSACVPKTDF